MIRQLLTILSFAPALCMAQSTTENYAKTETMLDAEGSNTMTYVQYYNGLGYPTVSVGSAGGNGETAYSLTTYDGLGREVGKYLPVADNGRSVLYKTPGEIMSGLGDETACSLNHYDALGRVTSVELPGAEWRNNDKRNVTEYSANTDADKVLHYMANPNGEYSLVKPDDTANNPYQYYPAGTLAKEVSLDADGKRAETFRDLFGRLILQRTVISSTIHHDTYYVYDGIGRLCYVLTPLYQKNGKKAQTAYEYRYDDRGRMVKKILPGAEYVQYWYDEGDRMTAMQDGVMRKAGKYRFFAYDRFSRLVVQGLCTNCRRSGTAKNATFSTSAAGVLGTGYVMPSDFTSSLENAELEAANYYDGNHCMVSGSMSTYFYGLTLPQSSVSQAGQLTGVIAADTDGGLLAQAMQYDIRGNVTCSMAKGLGGRIISNTSSYTHTNKLSQTTSTIGVGYGGSVTVAETIGYNPYNDRKQDYALTVSHGSAASASMTYAYDNLGRLSTVTRPFPSSTNRDVTYGYDIRGWLTDITTGSFAEELFYADGPGSPCFNGNISSIRWKDGTSGVKRGYKYDYDGANRLLSGAYGEGDALSDNTKRYSENIRYNANGNIRTIVRYGKKSYYYGVMDNLLLTYNGNQLSSVLESIEDYNANGLLEYKKAKGSGYMYNENGSLVADKSRGIAYITYDYNNNPRQVYFTNGSVTKYVYSASGEKLRTVHYTAKPNISCTWGEKPAGLTSIQILQADSTDYLLGGSLTLRNGRIDKFRFEGGYAQASAAGATADDFTFYYYNQDHLGNNREVVDASGTVQQVMNYYPFGMPYSDQAGTFNSDFQPYQYNGKELDKMYGLYTYDYGARQYDPVLVCWDRIDPLAEKDYQTSPYVFCGDNPINRIDKDGRIWDTVFDVACLAYDVAEAGYQYCTTGSVSNTTKAALGADALAAVVPGLTGTGLAVRAGAKTASKSIEVTKGAEKVLQSTNKSGKIEKLRKSAEIGQEAHRQIERNLERTIPGTRTEVKINLSADKSVRKDAVLPDGKVVIIKPDTKSGHKAAMKREKLMQEHGYDTQTIYYDPQNPAYLPTSPTYIGPKNK